MLKSLEILSNKLGDADQYMKSIYKLEKIWMLDMETFSSMNKN